MTKQKPNQPDIRDIDPDSSYCPILPDVSLEPADPILQPPSPLTPLEEVVPYDTMVKRQHRKNLAAGHKFGNVILKEIGAAAAAFGLSRQQATTLCYNLRVPMLHIGESILFNEAALTRILYYLTRAGGPGFAAPGSRFKDKYRRSRSKDTRTPALEITDDMLAEAAGASMLAEMCIVSGRQKPTVSQLTRLMEVISPNCDPHDQEPPAPQESSE